MNKKFKQKILDLLHDNSGAVAALTGVMMMVFLGFTALAIDTGHLTMVKSELQRAADAGALAGVRALYPYDLAAADPTADNVNTTDAYNKALEILKKNVIGGKYLENDAFTITPGIYSWTEKTFTPNGSPVSSTNAVLVEIKNHAVKHFLGGIIGGDQTAMTVTALAVMDYAKGLPGGTLPIAIGDDFLSQLDGTVPLKFSSDPVDNAGWFGIDGVNNNQVVKYIENNSCPPIEINDLVSLLNGKASATDELFTKFQANASNGYWDVNLPVVNKDKFNQTAPITSFVKFRITKIDTQKKEVWGKVLGLGVSGVGAKPGGPKGGLLTSPRLVAYN